MSLSVGLAGGGGRRVAIARGVITIDITNSRSTVISAAREMGQQVQRNIGGQTQAGVRQANESLRGLNQSLAATARAFAAAFAIRQLVTVTQNIARVDALFKTLIGSEEKTNKELDRLRKLADDANIPFRELVASSNSLLPAIRGTNADLSQTLLLAGRLAELDPAQGFAGAAFAIRELLSGQVISLSSRFELPRAELRQLLEEADGDAARILDGLSNLVDGLGLTEEAYIDLRRESRDVFAETRSEIQETIAFGFTPLLQDGINPAVSGFNDLLRLVRESNPELTKMAVTLAAIAATTKSAQFLGVPGAGRAGALGAAGFIGVEAGVAGSRFLAEQGIINNPQLENVSQRQATQVIFDTLKQAVVGAANTLVTLGGIFALGGVTLQNAFERAKLIIEGGGKAVEIGFLVARDAVFDFRDGVVETLRDLRTGLSGFLVSLGASIPGGAGGALTEAGLGLLPRLDAETEQRRAREAIERDAAITEAANQLAQITQQLQAAPLAPTADQAGTIAASTEELRQQLVGGLAEALFPVEEQLDDLAASGEAAASALSEVEGFSDEQVEAFEQFQDDLKAIQDDAQQKRQQAEEQHQEKLTEIQASRQRQRERNDAAEQRRRQKAEENLADSIAETYTDGADRVADVVAKGKAEEIKQEEQHQRRRIDRLRQLGRDLLDAAASLDARAVFHLLQQNRERAEDEQIARDREADDRRNAQAERIREIQDETQERVAALRQQFVESEAERAEERAIQRAIEDEDFQIQLDKLNAENEKRLAQIDTQAQRETQAREAAFIEQHNALIEEQGTHNERMIEVQRQGTDALEKQYADWLLRMQRRTGQLLSGTQVALQAVPRIRPLSFQSGGRLPHTGLFFGHEGEQVIPANASQMLRRAVGGELTPSSLLGLAEAGSGRSLQTGDVNIDASGTHLTPSQMERIIERALIDILDRM